MLAAIGRDEIADYVDALFLVYLILIFVRILLSWIPRIPYNPILSAVIGFINDVTNPYLKLFRRVLPPVGGGGFALDLSPIIATIVLIIARAIIVGRSEAVAARVDGAVRRLGAGAGVDGDRGRARPGRPSRSSSSTSRDGEPVELIFGFKLSNVRNDGIAFGLLEGAERRGRDRPDPRRAGAAGRLLRRACDAARPVAGRRARRSGGALGNLADRVRIGAAIDFLDPPLWPAFNVADIAIVVGVALLVFAILSPGAR